MSESASEDARDRYARAVTLFDTALELRIAARDAFIADAVRGDAALADDVRSLLSAHLKLEGFLEVSSGLDPELQHVRAALADRYAIKARIASGGMATVYRADDLRHARSVAIKVFAPAVAEFALSASGQQRFLDEITVTAQLQHANVMPLFDSGTADGRLFYVMPFIDDETLRQQLRRAGPLSLDVALGITRGIASALDHAHARGIVHRDLKPENILLRDGQPLVCDFGIALATAGLGSTRLTQSGVVIGTPQYMSPEQAAGDAVIDARTDVYALGAMLYEMLIGDPPHLASTSQGILAKVRAERPTSVHVLRPAVSVAVSDVIDRALAKLPADRYPSARILMCELDDANAVPSTPVRSDADQRRSGFDRYRAVALVATLAAVIVIMILATRRGNRAPATTEFATRFVVAPIADAAIGRAPTITPDGAALVYAGAAATGRRLFVRRVNELEARALPGTSGVLNTWVSPDGSRVAFTTADDRVKVIGLDGRDMRDVAGVFRYGDAAWISDSVLVIDSFGQQGLSSVAVSGGTLQPLTTLDSSRHDTVHSSPIALGDGRTIVFVTARNRSGPGTQSGELSLVRFEPGANGPALYQSLGVMASQPFAFVDGWLLYVAVDARRLMAVRFDVTSGVVSGTPIPVLEQNGGGIERVMLARNGTLLYARRVLPKNAPVLVDMQGLATPMMPGLSGGFMNPRVSPDGRRLLVQRASAEGNDAWVYDLATGTGTRLTRSGTVLGPAWTADGQRAVYASTRDAQDVILSSRVDGTGNEFRVATATGAFATSPARAGGVLLFQRRTHGVWGIWQAPDAPTSAPVAIVDGNFDAFMPSLSPDGRWLTYASSESGRYEIYLRPFPGPGAAMQVSTDGGTEPVWSADGRRIFYRGDRRLQVANISPGDAPTVTERRVLFEDLFDGDMPMPHRNYDVTPDGKGFVMIAPVAEATPETVVVLNWVGEFRARVAQPRARAR